jgi:formate hydrogenlyase transcriptional activator
MDDEIRLPWPHETPWPDYSRVVEQLLEQLNQGRDFEQLLTSIYEQLRGVVPCDRIAVAVLTEDQRSLVLISCRSDHPTVLPTGYRASLSGSTLEDLLITGQPRIINDLEAYLATKPASRSTQMIVQEGMRSNLTLPLLSEGKPIGVVFFSSRDAQAYTDGHAKLLKSLAGHIAISIEKAQLIAALQKRNEALAEANQVKDQFLDRLRAEVKSQTVQIRESEERYRLLARLARLVNSSLEPEEVFRSAADEVHNLIACDRVSLLLVGREQSSHGFAIDFGPGRRWVEVPTQSLAGSAAEWVMDHRRPRVADDLTRQQDLPEDQRLFQQGFRSYLYLPLVCRQVSVGVLLMAFREPRRAAQQDLDLLGELCELLATALEHAAAYREIASLKAQLEEENYYLRGELKTVHDFSDIVGESRAMRSVRGAIQQVAQTDSTVLILGETGTGKELVARAVHDFSSRRKNLMVRVNCAALAPGVITSELFGHEAGAFTGATEERQGRFEIAQKGTILLDEIAEIPAETQVMLLRVLQERVIERVGGNRPIAVNVRVIAATNRNLREFVDQGHFRSDLFYRLNVFPIQVPPLRERREDIPALINHFISRFARRMNKDITRVNRRTMACLMDYQWPGNVRELENIIERAMIVSRGDTLVVDANWLHEDGYDNPLESPASRPLAEIERQAILQALQRSGGRVYGPHGAAEALAVKPTTLYSKMSKLGIARRPAGFDVTPE